MVGELINARRTEPPYGLAERPMLEAWLEFHRATLELKCEGLDATRLAARPVPTSALSLHGLVRHMADVERGWFTRTRLRAPDTRPLFYDPAVEDSGLTPLDGADATADLRTRHEECERRRQHAAPATRHRQGPNRGQPVQRSAGPSRPSCRSARVGVAPTGSAALA